MFQPSRVNFESRCIFIAYVASSSSRQSSDEDEIILVPFRENLCIRHDRQSIMHARFLHVCQGSTKSAYVDR